jgi:hypothetical protein
MAAGLGFKDFVTGEVLTAADVDGYLMQGIWVFASAAARDAAVTSPQEGNACYLKDTNQVLTYSGSAWVAVGGGSPLTTKGDLYGFSTVDARIPIGTNNQVLTADSTQALGLKWATPAAGGKVLQVIFGSTSTDTTTSTSTFVDTSLTATITPTSATSKILVMFSQNGVGKGTNNTAVMHRLLRGATVIANTERFGGLTNTGATNFIGSISAHYLDEPATTSATTYKTQFASQNNQAIIYAQATEAAISALSTMILMEIGA